MGIIRVSLGTVQVPISDQILYDLTTVVFFTSKKYVIRLLLSINNVQKVIQYMQYA